MEKLNDDLRLLKLACLMAKNYSTDPLTQNGAIIVTRHMDTVRAANNFARGVNNYLERWERPTKYYYVEHAERNVIYEAARLGIATAGGTMYCPLAACADCARAIIQAGIIRLVRRPHDTTMPARWVATCEAGDIQLREAGVVITELTEPFENDFFILRNGEWINP